MTERLASGMSAVEAARRARRWWNGFGRYAMLDRPLVDDGVAGRMSGILRGLVFDDLTRDEALAVVTAWHENTITITPPGSRRDDPGIVTIRASDMPDAARRRQ